MAFNKLVLEQVIFMFLKGIMGNFSASKQQVYKEGYLLPVMTSEKLLAAGRHQAVLRQLKDTCGLPEEYYEAFYRPMVDAFVEFVQVLPTEFDGPLCGMMNEGIARAMIAMQTYQLEHQGQVDPLKAYAAFAAGLFRDISHVLMNQRVVLTDEEGKFLENWHPFSGFMVGRAEFYRLIPVASVYQRLDVTLRHLLARQLMPARGYQWIAADLHILADWFDALSGEQGGAGTLMHTLAYMKRDDVVSLQNSLVQVPVKQAESSATEHGQAFYRWLTDGLAKKQINVNTADAAVHIVQEGVFLERPRLFKEFLEVYNQPVTLNVVFAQFGNLMGIAKKGGYDFMNAQYFSEYSEGRESGARAFASPISGKQQSLRDGMVLADPSRVFLNARIPAVTPLLRQMQSKAVAHYDLPSLTSDTTPSPTPSPDNPPWRK